MEKSAQKRRATTLACGSQPVPAAIRTERQFPGGDLSSCVFKGARMKYSVIFKWTEEALAALSSVFVNSR